MKPTYTGKRLNKPAPFSRAGRNQSPQVQGRLQEKEIAKDLLGYTQPASGAFLGKPGDVVVGEWLIECKYTKKQSYAVSIEALRKIKDEAFCVGKKPAFLLVIGGMVDPERWVLTPYDDWIKD